MEISKEDLDKMFPDGYERLKDEEYPEFVVIPATLKVLRYHVAVYKSHPDKNGNVEFVRSPRHGKLFGSDSLASPSIVGAVINGKFGNSNPLNRLSNALIQKEAGTDSQKFHVAVSYRPEIRLPSAVPL